MGVSKHWKDLPNSPTPQRIEDKDLRLIISNMDTVLGRLIGRTGSAPAISSKDLADKLSGIGRPAFSAQPSSAEGFDANAEYDALRRDVIVLAHTINTLLERLTN